MPLLNDLALFGRVWALFLGSLATVGVLDRLFRAEARVVRRRWLSGPDLGS